MVEELPPGQSVRAQRGRSAGAATHGTESMVSMVAQGQKFVADSISRWIDMTSGPFGMPLASGEAPFGGLLRRSPPDGTGLPTRGGTARLAEGLRAEGHGRNERGERRVTLPVEDLGVNAYDRLGSTPACGSTRPGSAFSSPPTPPRSANARRDVASADDVRRSLMDARSGCATSAVSECAHFEGAVAPARKVSRSRVIGQLRGMTQIHDPDAPNGERPVAAGRNADAPHDIPARGWLQVLKRVKTESVADNASLMAGGVAFFVLLAIVPLLVAALSIWGLFASPTDATRLIRDIATGLPHSAQRLIMQQLRSITRRSNGGLSITAAISLLIALWSASSGTKHLIEAVNTAYDEDEERGFVRVRALALVLTIGAIVFAFVAIALIAVVPTAIADAGVPRGARIVIDIAIWVLLALMMIGAAGSHLPCRARPPRSCVAMGVVGCRDRHRRMADRFRALRVVRLERWELRPDLRIARRRRRAHAVVVPHGPRRDPRSRAQRRARSADRARHDRRARTPSR